MKANAGEFYLHRLLFVPVVFVIFVGVSSVPAGLLSPPRVSQHRRATVHVLGSERRDQRRVIGIKHVHFHLGLLRRSLLRFALVLAQLRIDGVLPAFRRRQRILHTRKPSVYTLRWHKTASLATGSEQ